MKRDYKLYINDIRESIKRIEEYLKGISEEGFRKDVKLQDAVIRRLEIIGEASRNIPRALKEKNKQVPWCQEPPVRDWWHEDATHRMVLEHYQNSTSDSNHSSQTSGILKFKMEQYRDFIVHSYFEASLRRIWVTSTTVLSEIKESMKKIALV